MTYKNDEIMKWQVKTPNGTDIVYIKNNKPVIIADMVREEEKKMRVERLKKNKKKKAFYGLGLLDLHRSRANGMSIRKLALKYDKSTRTIQKYLKIEPQKLKKQ